MRIKQVDVFKYLGALVRKAGLGPVNIKRRVEEGKC